MKKYPEYKSSGVKWLNEIPSSWVSNRLASFGRFTKGSSISKSDLVSQGLPVILYGDIYTKYNLRVDNVINFIPKELADVSKLIRRGDILFTGSGETREDIGKCIVYYSNKEAYAGGDTIIFTPKNHDCLFLAYSLNSNIVVSKKAMDSKGDIIVHIYASLLRNISIPIPPLYEQHSIVRFLDYKTGHIDRFIANRQKQIELLKEQLHFKINEAITKGINRLTKYKSTDIKYVPEIPEHWDIRKFKGLTSILTCGVAATPEYVEESEGVLFLSAQNVKPFRMVLEKLAYIKPSLHKQLTRYKKPQKGDVLVTRVGGESNIGDACIVNMDIEFSIYVSLTHIRPNKKILSEYIVYFFNTEYCYQLNHEGTVAGGGQGNLNVKNVERYRIPLPPIEEQREIIEYLDNYRVEIDTLISKYQKQIELMQEYRTSLISQAVTGKIDVRDWEPKGDEEKVVN